MNYAPILITTVNRYECLKKCIESLQKNTWASETELYISVDYPPSVKYVEGYTKICKYLSGELLGFKNVCVFFQEKNLGIFENINWLKEKILGKYDRYIFLEDDNELAPGFIQFCDKGLELFENDDSIIAINASDYVWCGDGYTPEVRKREGTDATVEKRQLLFHASAFWFKKERMICEFCDSGELYRIHSNFHIMRRLYVKSKCFFYVYLCYIVINRDKLPWYKGKIQCIDSVWDIFMLINDKYVISPVEPLTRDLGVDGNGEHFSVEFKNATELKNRQWSCEEEFHYIFGDSLKVNDAELALHDHFNKYSIRSKCKIWIRYALVLIKTTIEKIGVRNEFNSYEK